MEDGCYCGTVFVRVWCVSFFLPVTSSFHPLFCPKQVCETCFISPLTLTGITSHQPHPCLYMYTSAGDVCPSFLLELWEGMSWFTCQYIVLWGGEMIWIKLKFYIFFFESLHLKLKFKVKLILKGQFTDFKHQEQILLHGEIYFLHCSTGRFGIFKTTSHMMKSGLS